MTMQINLNKQKDFYYTCQEHNLNNPLGHGCSDAVQVSRKSCIQAIRKIENLREKKHHTQNHAHGLQHVLHRSNGETRVLSRNQRPTNCKKIQFLFFPITVQEDKKEDTNSIWITLKSRTKQILDTQGSLLKPDISQTN